jgi:hypothetical protein
MSRGGTAAKEAPDVTEGTMRPQGRGPYIGYCEVKAITDTR